MAKQHVSIFAALGLPQAEIDKIEALKDEDLKEWKSDDVVTLVRKAMRTSLENDQEFLDSIPEDKIPETIKKNIEKGQYARFQNELIEVATKKLGLEDKDLTAEDRKSIKGMAEKMANLYLGKKGNVEGLQKMQGELAKARQDLEARDTEHATKLETELAAVTGKYSTKLMKTLTGMQLASLDKIKLNVGASHLTDSVLAKLGVKYKLVLNDNDELDIKQKENEKLDVMDTKGKKITFGQALRDIVLEEKLGTEVKENPDPPKPTRVIVSPVEGGEPDATAIPDYIQKGITEIQSAEPAK